ncbi:hypothetical protein B0T21DRAFT_355278 [Apiosordaria backusii]|uniref:Uncharacterized protein n=1 Tax=Apiosordaria backusii TaxID=314023 RepID=A0AA40EYG2_9PEZI|nr:hypothetical protein B0T21DRAFT_355278 [Apiosordaria backusii]
MPMVVTSSGPAKILLALLVGVSSPLRGWNTLLGLAHGVFIHLVAPNPRGRVPQMSS